MFSIKEQLKKRFNEVSLEVIIDSYRSTIVKGIGLLVGVLISIFLGRTLGADGYGIISLANRVAGIILVFCFLGMKQVIIKEVSIGYAKRDWVHISNVMYSSYLVVGGFTVVVSTGFIFSASYLANQFFKDPRLEIPLIIIFIVLIPQIFTKIFSSSLIGAKKIWQSILLNHSMDFIVIGTLLLIVWLSGIEITVISVIIIYALGRLFIAICSGVYWHKLIKVRPTRKFVGSKLLKTSAPLILVGATSVLYSNADSVMLGWLNTSKEVGIYVVAARLSLLTSIFLHVTSSVISPRIATLFDKKSYKQLESLIQKVTTVLFFISILPLIVFALYGKPILSIWGSEFVDSYWVLLILSIGQFVNVTTGATGLTLSLCGEERIYGLISVVFAILNLVLNYLLIIRYGAVGAATATAITIISLNLVQLLLVKRKIGILTIPNLKHFIQ